MDDPPTQDAGGVATRQGGVGRSGSQRSIDSSGRVTGTRAEREQQKMAAFSKQGRTGSQRSIDSSGGRATGTRAEREQKKMAQGRTGSQRSLDSSGPTTTGTRVERERRKMEAYFSNRGEAKLDDSGRSTGSRAERERKKMAGNSNLAPAGTSTRESGRSSLLESPEEARTGVTADPLSAVMEKSDSSFNTSLASLNAKSSHFLDKEKSAVGSSKPLMRDSAVARDFSSGAVPVAMVVEEDEKIKELREKKRNLEMKMELAPMEVEAVDVAVAAEGPDEEVQSRYFKRRALICGCGLVFVVVAVVVGVVVGGGGDPATPPPRTRSPTVSPTSRPTSSPTAALSQAPSSTLMPSLMPTSSAAPTDTPCLEDATTLKNAVDAYLQNSTATTPTALRYGHPIGSWCVSGIEDFSALFSSDRNINAVNFNEDLSSWDVSSATNMEEMFAGSRPGSERTTFNQPINAWNVSSVTNMRAMFKQNRDFNQDISDWDVRKVLSMEEMFHWAASFNQDLSSWNLTSVTDISSMFAIALAFDQNLCAWGDSLGTNVIVSQMFADGACEFSSLSPDLTATPPGPFCSECV